VLEVADLHVHYGRVAALQGVSLTVAEGEAVALVGPNGAGKSTLLSAITGIVRPSSGTVAFEGKSIAGEAPERIVTRGVSLVPEGRDVFSTLTVAENLQVGTTIRKDRKAAGEDLERILEWFPILREYYKTPAGRLSGGEQQQLSIARALLCRPRLLLLDEPSLGLAPIVIDLVFEILGELRRRGITILLVEQAAERAITFADRTYILRSGKVAATGDRENIREAVNLAHAYLGV
jgi:branched-chain amino acid transport system ATP-binding protein